MQIIQIFREKKINFTQKEKYFFSKNQIIYLISRDSWWLLDEKQKKNMLSITALRHFINESDDNDDDDDTKFSYQR